LGKIIHYHWNYVPAFGFSLLVIEGISIDKIPNGAQLNIYYVFSGVMEKPDKEIMRVPQAIVAYIISAMESGYLYGFCSHYRKDEEWVCGGFRRESE